MDKLEAFVETDTVKDLEGKAAETRQTRQVIRTGPFKSVIPDGVRMGDTIYLSGQVSVDEAGELLAAGDFGDQLRQVYRNTRKVLLQFGADMADIVDETVFVVDIDAFLAKETGSFNIRRDAFGAEPQVAQTLLQVSRLASPAWLVEIKCVARISHP